MTRAFFVLGLIGAAAVFGVARFGGGRRVARARGQVAGRCANQRRNLRWSGYTAASFD